LSVNHEYLDHIRSTPPGLPAGVDQYLPGLPQGRFHYRAKVTLADGSTRWIGAIVNQREINPVMAYDPVSNRVRPAFIRDWIKVEANGLPFLTIRLSRPGKNGHHSFGCSLTDMVHTQKGFRKIANITAGEEVSVAVPHFLSPVLRELVVGSILGDGSLRTTGDFTAQLRIGHGAMQDDYCSWKQHLFGELVRYNARNCKGGLSFETKGMYELYLLWKQNYGKAFSPSGHRTKRRYVQPNKEVIRELTPLSLAIWYMDDGTFDSSRNNRCSLQCNTFPEETLTALVQWFASKGMNPHLCARGRLSFGVVDTAILHGIICRFVPPSMQYKLIPAFRGRFEDFKAEVNLRQEVINMPVVSVDPKTPSRGNCRFGLILEDEHLCPLIDSVVVHP
jgi:recombination protein RecA